MDYLLEQIDELNSKPITEFSDADIDKSYNLVLEAIAFVDESMTNLQEGVGSKVKEFLVNMWNAIIKAAKALYAKFTGMVSKKSDEVDKLIKVSEENAKKAKAEIAKVNGEAEKREVASKAKIPEKVLTVNNPDEVVTILSKLPKATITLDKQLPLALIGKMDIEGMRKALDNLESAEWTPASMKEKIMAATFKGKGKTLEDIFDITETDYDISRFDVFDMIMKSGNTISTLNKGIEKLADEVVKSFTKENDRQQKTVKSLPDDVSDPVIKEYVAKRADISTLIQNATLSIVNDAVNLLDKILASNTVHF